jgi:hypothetical protein
VHPCTSAFGTIKEKKAFMSLRYGGFFIVEPAPILLSPAALGQSLSASLPSVTLALPWTSSLGSAAFVPKGISFGHAPCTSAYGATQEMKAFILLR